MSNMLLQKQEKNKATFVYLFVCPSIYLLNLNNGLHDLLK